MNDSASTTSSSSSSSSFDKLVSLLFFSFTSPETTQIMTLNLGPTLLYHFNEIPKSSLLNKNNSKSLLSILFGTKRHQTFSKLKLADSSSAFGEVAENSSQILSDELLTRVVRSKDAMEALDMIAHSSNRKHGLVSSGDCRIIINAAVDRNNADLAMSVFYAMQASFNQGNEGLVETWRWSRADVSVYVTLVQKLASSLRVSDALRTIDHICRVEEEVPFGKVVRCPSCMVPIAVAQPQHGIQVVSCAKCRYQYELVSGNITTIVSEELSKDIPVWERGLRLLQIIKKSIPASVHSIVVRSPSGVARTHRFAIETADLPAQQGERVTIASAAPSNVYREVGPFKFSPKAPKFYPGEPICLTNHKDGRESLLLRAPANKGSFSLGNPSILFPLLAVLATGDAASGMVDPSLPQFLSVAALTSLTIGATLNTLVLPQLNLLPQRSVDTVAIRQQLLSQYDLLQSRIQDLRKAAEKEVWMLARMSQLENKISAVGEPTYRARKTRVMRVRDSLEKSLKGRIELIDSYARISSMIEIEVEMDSDVLAAEAVSNTESIAEQIQQIMELENLEEKWRFQAEANDEVERLLSSQPTTPTEQKQGRTVQSDLDLSWTMNEE